MLGDGEFYEQRTDVSLPAYGPQFTFTRTYRSGVNTRPAGLGWSWDHNFDQRIVGYIDNQANVVPGNCPPGSPSEFDCETTLPLGWPYTLNQTNATAPSYPDGGFDYQDGALNIIHFHYVSPAPGGHYAGNYYEAPPGVALSAIVGPDLYGNEFTITDHLSGQVSKFNYHGLLSTITDLAGNSIDITWQVLPTTVFFDGTNAYVKTVDDGIRKINFIYNGLNLQCISTSNQCDVPNSNPLVRDAGVLAYYVIDPTTNELQTVYHGVNTTGERYVYYDKNFAPTAWPNDCISNITLSGSCAALCGKPDQNNLDATATYADYGTQVANACASVSCKSFNYNPYISCVSKPFDAQHPDSACMAYNSVLPDCLSGCLTRYQCNGLFPSMPIPAQIYPYIAFGESDDLAHNITDVYDESGQLVVHNEYGAEPWTISYDHVTSQQLGPGQPAAANETNVMTFQYHDLNIEALGSSYAPAGYYNGLASVPDADHVLAVGNFQKLNICPVTAQGTNETKTPAVAYSIYGQSLTDTSFRPTTAVVITDVHGITHTQYYDKGFNLVRQVDRDVTGANSQTTEYNYDANGFLIGEFEPSGVRNCFVVDAFGTRYQSTTIPAISYEGSQNPFVTVFGYDANRQLTDVYDDVAGFISNRHYGRDSHERVVELDEDIDVQSARHTYYSYDEDPPPETDTVPCQTLPCLAPTIRETPATVYHESRTAPTSIDTYRTLDPSGGGVQHVTLNSGGDLPKVRNSTYDSLGRLTDVVDSSGLAYHYDYEGNTGRVQQVKHQLDASSPFVAVQIAQHDSNGPQLDQLKEPYRKTHVLYSGPYPCEMDRIAGPPAFNPGQQSADQHTCLHYSADGRLEDVLLPETNRIHYEYDFAGRPVSTTKGNDPIGTKWIDSRCVNTQTTPLGGDNNGLHVLTQMQYSPSGFMSAIFSDDVWRAIYTDGFGRIIQTSSLVDSSVVNVAVKQFGYDSRGRLVWSADLASGGGLPAAVYAEPVPGQTQGLLDMTVYNYDYLDRRTGIYKYVIETGELYTTTWSYDDANMSVTMTDRGRVTQTAYDPLGRVRYIVLPDQSTINAIQYNQGSAVFTQDTNQGQQIRTYLTDSRGHLIGILDGNNNNNSLYRASYDDDGNLAFVQKVGEGAETRTFDSFDRLVQSSKDLQNGKYLNQSWGWDRNDRLATYTDGDMHVWRTTPTGFDSSFTLIDPVNRTTQNYYQQYSSHPAGITEGNGRSTCYRYDADLRLRYIYNAGEDCFRGSDGSILKPYVPMVDRAMYTYTDRGEVAEVDASPDASRTTAATVLMSYDSLGRKVSESTLGGDDALHEYDVTISYPDLGRTTSTQVSESLITADFCRNGICGSTPSTWMASFSRHHADGLDRLSSVDFNGQTIATYTNGYGIGGPTSISYPNILTTAQLTYDSRLRRTGTNVIFGPAGQTPSPVALLQDALGPDSVPRMRQRQFGSGSVLTDVFQVDADRRVIAEDNQLQGNIAMLPSGAAKNDDVSSLMKTAGSNWMQYGLDSEGNWSSNTNSAGTFQSQMDGMGRLQAVTTPTWSQPIEMDATDNIESLSTTSAPQFAFEPFTGLMYTATNNNSTAQYVYDALGRRAAEIVDGSLQVFLWDGQRIIAHGDPNSLTVDISGDDIDSHIASVDDGGTGKARYYHQGPDQSVLAVSDENGLVEGYSYSAFGLPSAATGETAFINRFLFQGQLYDPLTQTYAMRARQYWPAFGRFLSPDPLSFAAGPSVYSFTGSRPLVERDPSGMDGWDWGWGGSDWWGGLAGVIAGVVQAVESSGGGSSSSGGHSQPRGSSHSDFHSVPVPVPTLVQLGQLRDIYKGVSAGKLQLNFCSGQAAARSDLECAFGVTNPSTNSSYDVYQTVGANSGGSNQALNFVGIWVSQKFPGVTMNPETKANVVLLINLAMALAPVGKAAAEAIATFGAKAAPAALRFSQTTASATFSSDGVFAGKTIGSLAAELRAGTVAVSEVPVGVTGGLIVNTRSSLALMRAGIPQSSWVLIDVTESEGANIAARLIRNGLEPEGTLTLRITGVGSGASSLE